LLLNRGLHHGPMAALDEESLFVCFLSGNRRIQEYEAESPRRNREQATGHDPLVVAGSGALATDSIAEHILAPPVSLAIADDYRPPIDVIFGQLLGLFFSLRWNLRPDCPSSNDAISRVVQYIGTHS
jgi:tagatose-6-phosphate ketose/aldose isomerase